MHAMYILTTCMHTLIADRCRLVSGHAFLVLVSSMIHKLLSLIKLNLQLHEKQRLHEQILYPKFYVYVHEGICWDFMWH